jgi:hypothetical protein
MQSGVCRYRNQTLNGNWYEDRLDVGKCHPALARTGKHSETPMKFQDAPNMYMSTAREAYIKPRLETKIPDVSMINATNITKASDRSPQKGVVPAHEAGREFSLYTTTNSTYGGRDADSLDRAMVPNQVKLM